jgi:hypothetical protein
MLTWYVPYFFPPNLKDRFNHHANATNQTDPLLPYIRRFIASGFGVVDVNMPVFAPQEPTGLAFPQNATSGSYLQKPTGSALASLLERTTKELLCYLWDNYLEGYASNCIVLMGVGDSYLGVKQLLVSRGMFSSPFFLYLRPSCPSPIINTTSMISSGLKLTIFVKNRLHLQNSLYSLLRVWLLTPSEERNRSPP